MTVTVTRTKASALVSGCTPFRTLPTMNIVNVRSLPMVNTVVLKFSKDWKNDSATADRIAGRMYGSVIVQKTLSGVAPRSSAASSSVGSKRWSRAMKSSMQ